MEINNTIRRVATVLLFLFFTLSGLHAQPTEKSKASESATAQTDTMKQQAEKAVATADSLIIDSLQSEMGVAMNDLEELPDEETEGLHQQLKTKFIEGDAGYMSLVAITLILGLAFCIERIIYLTLSEINAKKLMNDLEEKLETNDVEGAKSLCRDTRGPVASICYQGLLHIDDDIENVERTVVSYGSVQSANLERGCSWITLFIAMAPSLGFLGTVIGMVMAFERIQEAGDISPTIVAQGMKVALLTTIFGIIVALILQLFYNYILSKIEHLTCQMEESAISLLDIVMKYKLKK